MAKKRERGSSVSGKPRHSLDVNHNGPGGAGVGKSSRSAGTILRLKMYNTRPMRDTKGKILKHDLQSKELPSTRIAPDNGWFGNTPVVDQKDLTFLPEEVERTPRRMSSNYHLLLKEKKLPMSLSTDPKKEGQSSHQVQSDIRSHPPGASDFSKVNASSANAGSCGIDTNSCMNIRSSLLSSSQSEAVDQLDFEELDVYLDETTLFIRQADLGLDHGPVLAIDTRATNPIDKSIKSNTHLKCMLTKFRSHVTASTGMGALSRRILQEVRSQIKRNENITLLELGANVKIELLDNLAREGLQNEEEEEKDLKGTLTVLSQREREFLHIKMWKSIGEKKFSINHSMMTSLTIGGSIDNAKKDNKWPTRPMTVNQVKNRLVSMMEVAACRRGTGGFCTIFSRDKNQKWICLECSKIRGISLS